MSFVVPRLLGRSRRGEYMEFVEMEKGGVGGVWRGGYISKL